MRVSVLITSYLLISGCSEYHLVPSAFDGEVIVQSELAASVKLNSPLESVTGDLTDIHDQEIFTQEIKGPNPWLKFDENDQQLFIESFKQDLVSTGIFRTIEDTGSTEAVEIIVNFDSTDMSSVLYREYTLSVSLFLRHQGNACIHRYEIVSSEGDTGWARWENTPRLGKWKAANKLLDALISDIQNFVRLILSV